MLNRNAIGVFLSVLISSSAAVGSDGESLHPFYVDLPVANITKYPFYSNNGLEPARSDLAVVNQIFMSNDEGERIAVISLKNLATSSHTISKEELVAVFANGSKSHPNKVDIKLIGGEALTQMFGFGKSNFPILYVYTRN